MGNCVLAGNYASKNNGIAYNCAKLVNLFHLGIYVKILKQPDLYKDGTMMESSKMDIRPKPKELPMAKAETSWAAK